VRGVAAVALGSNLESRFGDRRANLLEAVRRLGELGAVRSVSSFYDTEPVGLVEQPKFLNGALLLETNLEPLELMRGLLAMERSMGRERDGVALKGPRVIDLDLLLFVKDVSDQNGVAVVMSTEELTLPHPEMQGRRFVLEPLAEIAPGMVHPVLGLTVREIWSELVPTTDRVDKTDERLASQIFPDSGSPH
jgi:2-amino-4-hydroxy-6-hydroxymethyldihydropteridine diphosphokinase